MMNMLSKNRTLLVVIIEIIFLFIGKLEYSYVKREHMK
jgi:hypothetical protein